MSQEALDIYRTHRAAQVGTGVFSEEFRIITGQTYTAFRGVFDKSHMEDNKDGGNVMQKKLYPRIIVSEVPAGLVPRTSEIVRAYDGASYIFQFSGLDDEGIPVLWLVSNG